MRQFALLLSLSLTVILVADSNKPINSAPDVPVISPVPVEVGAPEAIGPAWKSAVFRVRQQNGRQQSGGTAVSLGSGLLVTAAHVVDGRGTPEVEVDGSWFPAGVSRVANEDVAYLTISKTDMPAVATRHPEYGETGFAYGRRTETVMQGMVSDDDAIALDKDVAGVDQGDSGGGVFGDDGKLLGTIRSHRQGNRRVVMFTPLDPPLPYALSQQESNAPEESVQKMIVFSASWCGPCQKYKPVLDSLGWDDAIQIVDMETNEGRQIMQELQFTPAKIPTTVLVEGGRIVKTQVGGMTAQQVKRFAGRE